MQWARVTVIVIFVSTALGCQSEQIIESRNHKELPTVQLVASAEEFDGRTIDEHLAALSDRVPGFGGMFRDSTGRLNVYLTNPASKELARTEISAFLDRAVDEITVVQGLYSFRQLYEWYSSMIPNMSISGLTITQIDSRRNRIQIGVLDEAVVDRVRTALQPFPEIQAATVIEVVAPTVTNATLRDYIRPIIAGIQIQSWQYTCTLGYVTRRQETGTGIIDSSTFYVLTNSHCTDVFGVTEGTIFGQPDIFNPIATEIYDHPLFTNASNPNCPVGRSCRMSDAAVLLVSSGVTATSTWAADSPSGYTYGTNPYSLNSILNINSVALGDPLVKIGRTTGEGHGTLTSQCANIPVYENIGGTIYDTGRTLLCQGQANIGSASGDSGGPVLVAFWWVNHVGHVLGMHWGGNGTTISFSPYVNNIRPEIAPATPGGRLLPR